MLGTRDQRCAALAAAIAAGVAGTDDTSSTLMFMDLDALFATLAALQAAPFPPGSLHTFAVKANPVGRLLELMREAGMGAEVASLGELRQALHCGFPPDRVVFDSPIKTAEELRFALRAGSCRGGPGCRVRLNLDNLQELERVAELVAREPQLLEPPGGGAGPAGSLAGPGPQSGGAAAPVRLIGLRINPQVGEGSIAALSTGGRVSKFGIPLLEARPQLLAAFRAHPWLNALHLHVGSQGVPLELTAEGVARVMKLAEEIQAQAEAEAATRGSAVEAAGVGPRVLALDIGGGLPVQYGSDDLTWLLGQMAVGATAASTAGSAAAHAPDRPAGGAGDCPSSSGSSSGYGSNSSSGDGNNSSSIFSRYAELLRQRVPGLFAPPAGASHPPHGHLPPPQLVTEFGRCMVAKAAFAAGRVEYTKSCGGRRVVVSGLGGDLLLRAVYLPATWPVRVELCGPDGAPKGASDDGPPPPPPTTQAAAVAAAALPPARVGDGALAAAGEAADAGFAPTDVVGPLCFQGDRLAEAVPLPPASPGDWVVVPDLGAYCLSMYSRYNSRTSPPVWAVWRVAGEGERDGQGAAGRLPAGWAERAVVRDGYAFALMRRGETVEEVLAFWNLGS
ncbi:hypothetical protein GPECTOR_2g1277 [Gonium pectorale]|uniref:Orn/DAP/Arg decarboxylase 2 N-terminal domain-containing protein n=1 Tax=Gonium pectorale TaxID=33097 RepID=A0A150H0N7_GONPE|nr:hypothetical protein GPECTOR_2g1277 [Gonium pectorale]|eukprot:KXZ55727.1 hypothetical protein GPECTOR_2g1277 [Gonium pectorale]